MRCFVARSSEVCWKDIETGDGERWGAAKLERGEGDGKGWLLVGGVIELDNDLEGMEVGKDAWEG